MDFEKLFNKLPLSQLTQSSSFKEELKDKESELIESLSNIHPIKGASVFAGLLLCPELQSNCLRLETIIHLILGYSNGNKKINSNLALKLFRLLENTRFQFHEDPAEDVFISIVSTKSENYRIYEGIWEKSAFNLQRFIDLIETMPDSELFNQLKESTIALMKLSDEIAERMNHEKYIIGQDMPLKKIPDILLDKLGDLKNCIKYSPDELNNLDINPVALAPFIFDLDGREKVLDSDLGSSPLERFPLVYDGQFYTVILPTAISVALRKYIIDILIKNGFKTSLEDNFAISYAQHFHEISILGDLNNSPVCFNRKNKNDILIAEFSTNIDVGRILHFIFILDNFQNYECSWINDFSPDIKRIGGDILNSIKNARNHFKDESGFRDGISLIVICGWGRPITFSFNKNPFDNWKIEHISAADLTTFSKIPEFKSLTLWRLLEAKYIIENHGIILQNVNGLLNLYSWAESINYHLIPHEQLPDDTTMPLQIVIEQNSFLKMRQKILSGWDEHIALTPENEYIRVCKLNINWHFEDDQNLPLYASLSDVKSGILKSYVKTSNTEWWCSIKCDKPDKNLMYKIWEAASIWMAYSLNIFNEVFIKMPNKIHWILQFNSIEIDQNRRDNLSIDELEKLIEINIFNSNAIKVDFKDDFIKGFLNETNIAERLIIRTLIIGLEMILSVTFNDTERSNILDRIIPDKWSKHIHLFQANSFRDQIASTLLKTLVIDKFDDSTSRIGLGWLDKNQKNSTHIVGVDNCALILNEVVKNIIEKIVKILQKLDREIVIMKLLQNHEAVTCEKDRWYRTIRSMLSLHNNKKDVLQVSSEQIFKFNAALLTSRIIVEIANCECAEKNGLEPGEIEISKLMTYAAQVFNLGNYSDAIKYEMMEPEIKISPLGDVMIHHDYLDNIIKPYGNLTEKKKFNDKADEYEKLYEPPQIAPSVESDLDSKFVDAWRDEFDFSIDEVRLFIDRLEDYGIEMNQPVYKISYSDLFSLYDTNCICTQETAKNVISAFELPPRNTWDNITSPYFERDIQPWRYKRRLSLLMKPLIKINDDDMQEYIIAPGLVRDGFMYYLRGCHEGSFDENLFKSKKMKKWIGARKNFLGHDFNRKVAERLSELGWNTEFDIKLTKVLNSKLDKNYGDIDVLAWRDKDSKVLCIECKYLEFAKTQGEVAKQLYEFRGKYDLKGKPDRLRKHLDRIDLLNDNKLKLRKFINKNNELIIVTILVFSNIVPIAFSKDEIFKDIKIVFFDELNNLK